MIAVLAGTTVIILVTLITRWILSVPMGRTLNLAVDRWADGVHGDEEPHSVH